MSTRNIPSERFEAKGLKVIGHGRVTIPATKRANYGAEAGTEIDVTVTTEGGDEFTFRDAKVTSKGRVCIPTRFQDRYGITDGDYIDMVVMKPHNAE